MNNLRKWKNSFMLIVLLAVASVFVFGAESSNAVSSQKPNSVNSSVKAVKKRIITPNQARNFLNDLDMPTRDYEKMDSANKYGRYQADSDRFMLETRDPDRFLNNLSYSVLGDKYIAKAVELDLNVNDMSFSSNAIGELIKYSDYLMYKVTSKHLTPQMKKAMQAKTSDEWVINGYKIKLKKHIFPDEKIVKGDVSTSDRGAFSLTFLIELFN